MHGGTTGKTGASGHGGKSSKRGLDRDRGRQAPTVSIDGGPRRTGHGFP
ncbi:hypothetical protein BRI6_2994 [plant metagenome]|uniref:Uncharacterized protein n=1 Tax=plant metagenome TaxID=1297885 RepID=A0A484YVH4_9ZZZZ